jgi:adenylate kinase family enzyme
MDMRATRPRGTRAKPIDGGVVTEAEKAEIARCPSPSADGACPMVDPMRAEIADIVDPQDRGRVKVRAPAMGEQWEAWAEVLRSGPLPTMRQYAPGDMVMIAFEGGDLELPIVLGALSSHTPVAAGTAGSRAQEAPAPLPETDRDWNDLVLPAETRDMLDEVVARVRNESELRGGWGLGRHFRAGFRVLFSGPPGTGKTMAAAVLAKRLAMPIFRIDLSSTVDKSVGDIEKDLRETIGAAEAGGGIVFIDEADALFGKRVAVEDSHDRYANLEVGDLLQRLEAFPGLVILASNLKQDMDKAFTRRLTAIVDFPMPDARCRLELWRHALRSLPPDRVERIDLSALARAHELSGGQIINVLGNACVRAAKRAGAVEQGDILAAIARLHPLSGAGE